jgi:hypothetical protein
MEFFEPPTVLHVTPASPPRRRNFKFYIDDSCNEKDLTQSRSGHGLGI